MYYCTYNHQSKCGFRIAIFQNKSSGSYTIVKGLVSHCNHGRNYFKGEALPKQVKTIITSPTTLRLRRPGGILREALARGICMNENQQKQGRRLYGKMSKASKGSHLTNGGDGSTWGDAVETIESFKRENIPDFDEHSVFLLGDKYLADDRSYLLIGAFSTENLLLNAFRQSRTGQDLFIAIDTSYRYTPEKIGLMPIKTMSLAQEGKTIAYGVVSKEDGAAHEFILDNVKSAVEEVVHSRRRSGATHV